MVGSLDTVRAALQAFIGRAQADELIVVSQVFDHAARLRSYELAATLHQPLHRNVIQA
jgi:alkanesulfonate monooxygenase SsuD/methylene tetrahydromethanopterin reductase-like flavin-dependent oxidoreductase (luciferase family)